MRDGAVNHEEITIVKDEEPCLEADELLRLLRATQALPAARSITEEELDEEVATYRAETAHE